MPGRLLRQLANQGPGFFRGSRLQHIADEGIDLVFRQISLRQQRNQHRLQFGQIALANMLLQQFQHRHTLVAEDMIIWHNGQVHQRKISAVQRAGKLRKVKKLEPVERMWPGADGAVIKQNRDHQRQRIVAGIQVALHGGQRIAHQAKSHQLIRRALMFNQRVDISRAVLRLQGVENVGVAGSQVFFDKAAGSQLQRIEIADT